jgi:hypothetical protein
MSLTRNIAVKCNYIYENLLSNHLAIFVDQKPGSNVCSVRNLYVELSNRQQATSPLTVTVRLQRVYVRYTIAPIDLTFSNCDQCLEL